MAEKRGLTRHQFNEVFAGMGSHQFNEVFVGMGSHHSIGEKKLFW